MIHDRIFMTLETLIQRSYQDISSNATFCPGFLDSRRTKCPDRHIVQILTGQGNVSTYCERLYSFVHLPTFLILSLVVACNALALQNAQGEIPPIQNSGSMKYEWLNNEYSESQTKSWQMALSVLRQLQECVFWLSSFSDFSPSRLFIQMTNKSPITNTL